MPSIQLEDQSPLVNTQVHGADIPVDQMGSQYGALAGLGQDVEKLGNTLMEKRKSAQTADFAFQATNKYAQDYESEAEDARKNFGPGSIGYSEHMNKFSEDYYNDIMNDAPSLDAKRLFDQNGRRLMVENGIKAEAYENSETAKMYENNTVDNTNTLAKEFMNNPPDNDSFTLQLRSRILSDIDAKTGSVWGDDQATQLKQKAGVQASVGAMEGYIAQQQYGTAKRLLTDGGAIEQAMDAHTKKEYLEKLDHLIDTAQTEKASSVVKDTQEMVYHNLKGLPVSGNDIVGQIAKINAIPDKKLDQEGKGRLIQDLHESVINGNVISDVAITPKSKWDSITPKYDSSVFNQPARDRMNEAVERQKQYIDDAREGRIPGTNGAKEVLDHFPALEQRSQMAFGSDAKPQETQSFITDLLAKQKVWGVNNTRILDPHSSDLLATTINQAKGNPDAMAQAISKISDQTGPYFGKVMNELAQDTKKGGNGINPDLALVGFVNDKNAQSSIVNNIVRATPIVSGFDASHKGDGTESRLQMEVNRVTAPAVQAINGWDPNGGNGALSKSVWKQVSLESRKLMNDDSHLKVNDAVKQAYQNIITNNFNIETAGSSTIFVPKTVNTTMGPSNNDSKMAKNFAIAHSTPEGLSKLDISPPPGPAKDWFDKNTQTTNGKELFYKTIAPNIKWVNNNDMSGLQLIYKNGDHVTSLNDSKGQPITKSFQDITHTPDDLTVKQSKKIIGSFGFSQ